MSIEEANKYKALGNECFSAKKYDEAVQHFSKAIELNPNDHVFFSNRSACYASLEQYEKALEDADKCVTIKPDWSKGYLRKGLAEFYLEKHEDAEKTYQKGLDLDPSNQQLKDGLERVKETKDSGESGFGGDFMQQAFGKLLMNPETAGYFQDPEFMKKLTAIQKNPQSMSLYMSDPKIQKAFQVILSGYGAPGGEGGFGGPGGATGPGGAKFEGFEDSAKDTGASQEEAKSEPTKTQPQPEQPKPKTEAPKSKPQAGGLSPAEEAKNRGNDEYKKKNFDQAITHYEKAIELDPNEPIYYNNLAAVYLEKKQVDKAIESCDKAEEVCKAAGHYDYVKLGKILARKASAYTQRETYRQH